MLILVGRSIWSALAFWDKIPKLELKNTLKFVILYKKAAPYAAESEGIMRKHKTKPLLALVLAGAMLVSGMTAAAAEPAAGTTQAPKKMEGKNENGNIDVYDFGAADLGEGYNTMLTKTVLNGFYPGKAAGTVGENITSFAVKNKTGDTLFAFDDGGNKNTHRLRTVNKDVTRYDEKSLKFAGNTYNGYLYSNKSMTDTVNLSIYAESGDIITVAASANSAKSVNTYTLESPSGAKTEQNHTGVENGTVLTYYASETGMYKLYTLTEKLVVARVTVESPVRVPVSGTVTAPADIPAGYKIVFTSRESGEVTAVPVQGGTYAANLCEQYTYDVSLEGANSYVINSARELALAKGAGATAFDINVNAVDLVTVTGKIKGLRTSELEKLALVFVSDEIYKPEISINGDAYTLHLEKGVSYDIHAGMVNDYALTRRSIAATENATRDFIFEKKPAYKVNIVLDGAAARDLAGAEFVFTNLDEEGYVYTFTGSEGIRLRDGVYKVEVKSDTYTQKLTSNVKVDGKNMTKTISFAKEAQEEKTAYRPVLQVGKKGFEFQSINDALLAVYYMDRPNNERVTIEIQPGNYEEMLVIGMPNITLKNASKTPSLQTLNKGVDIDKNAVRITSYYGHGYNYYSMGEDGRWSERVLKVSTENGCATYKNTNKLWNATVAVSADGFNAEGIIFENSFNQYISEKEANDTVVALSDAPKGEKDTPRVSMKAGSTAVQNKPMIERASAVGIDNGYKQIYFDNCKFIGRQDTLFGGTGSTAAFYNCSVYGAVDYIYGGMTAVFAKCDLVFNTSEDPNDTGYITAAQQNAGDRGYLMYNCTVKSTTPGVDTASVKTSKPGLFGRPWKADTSEVLFYKTIIEQTDFNGVSESLIQPKGWINTLSGESPFMQEYASIESTGAASVTSARAGWTAILSADADGNVTLSDKTTVVNDNTVVEAFLGEWNPFAGKDMSIVQ